MSESNERLFFEGVEINENIIKKIQNECLSYVFFDLLFAEIANEVIFYETEIVTRADEIKLKRRKEHNFFLKEQRDIKQKEKNITALPVIEIEKDDVPLTKKQKRELKKLDYINENYSVNLHIEDIFKDKFKY